MPLVCKQEKKWSWWLERDEPGDSKVPSLEDQSKNYIHLQIAPHPTIQSPPSNAEKKRHEPGLDQRASPLYSQLQATIDRRSTFDSNTRLGYYLNRYLGILNET